MNKEGEQAIMRDERLSMHQVLVYLCRIVRAGSAFTGSSEVQSMLAEVRSMLEEVQSMLVVASASFRLRRFHDLRWMAVSIALTFAINASAQAGVYSERR